MILRKPYALFIKSFKFIHFLLVIGIGYTIYRTNIILTFFNEAILQPSYNLKKSLEVELIDTTLYAILILAALVSGLLMGILIYKKKPFKFYIFSLIALISVFSFKIYLSEVIYQMGIKILTGQSISLMRDFILIALLLQIIVFIRYAISAIGFDVKSFDFGQDLEEMEIEEADREEFEVNLEFDMHSKKRKAKNIFQQSRYFYYENRFFVHAAVVFLIIFSGITVYVVANERIKALREHNVYIGRRVTMSVNNSYIATKDYRNNVIVPDDMAIVVVDMHMASRFNDTVRIDNSRFKLRIGMHSFYHTDKYRTGLSDIGITYHNHEISSEGENFILVFEIPQRFINRPLYFNYIDVINPESEREEDVKVVLLEPINVDIIEMEYIVEEGEKMYFREPLLHSYIEIVDYEIREEFKLGYVYCYGENLCMPSYEYIRASYHANQDMALMQLKGSFRINEELQHLNINLHQFLQKFGHLQYKIGDETFFSRFDQKVDLFGLEKEDVYYLEVPKIMVEAGAIDLHIVIRNFKYTKTLY